MQGTIPPGKSPCWWAHLPPSSEGRELRQALQPLPGPLGVSPLHLPWESETPLLWPPTRPDLPGHPCTWAPESPWKNCWAPTSLPALPLPGSSELKSHRRWLIVPHVPSFQGSVLQQAEMDKKMTRGQKEMGNPKKSHVNPVTKGQSAECGAPQEAQTAA